MRGEINGSHREWTGTKEMKKIQTIIKFLTQVCEPSGCKGLQQVSSAVTERLQTLSVVLKQAYT